MATQISGTTGIDKVQAGSIVQSDLAPNVVGNGPVFITDFSGTAVNAAVLTEITTNSKSYDTGNFLSGTTGRFQPAVAGFYQVSANISTGGAAIGGLLCEIRKNGARVGLGICSAFGAADTTTYKIAAVSGLIYLNGSTDYISVFGYGASGAFTCTGSFSGFLARAA